jgi:phosphate transport system protein
VDGAIEQAMAALTARDARLANQVVAGDEAINQLRFDIEQKCLLILSTQQPLAKDLRAVLAAIHVVTELERIGDHASGIARLVAQLQEEPVTFSLHKLPKMGRRARQMVAEGMDAFTRGDVAAARAMVGRDDKLDRQYHQLLTEELEEMRRGENARRATFLLWVGHNLERIGDRATNIAERVIFLSTGEFVENLVPTK